MGLFLSFHVFDLFKMFFFIERYGYPPPPGPQWHQFQRQFHYHEPMMEFRPRGRGGHRGRFGYQGPHGNSIFIFFAVV